MAMREKGIRILLSYHRHDAELVDSLVEQLEPFQESGQLDLSRNELTQSSQSLEDIQEDLPSFDVIILCISEKYISLQSLIEKEIPAMILPLQERGTRVIPLCTKPSSWQSISWLSKMELWPNHQAPLSQMAPGHMERQISRFIRDELKLVGPEVPKREHRDGEAPPASGKSSEGKFKDLGQLSDAFLKFLVEKKGYHKSEISQNGRDGGFDDRGIDKGQRQYMAIFDPETHKHLAFVEFGLEEDESTILTAWEYLNELKRNVTSPDIEGYCVFAVEAGLEKEFSIIRFDKNGKGFESLLCADFPAYEDLRRKVVTKTGAVNKERDAITSMVASFEKNYKLLSPTSKIIVDDAAKLAKQWVEIGALTTSCLLYAFLGRGESEAKRFQTAKFFHDRIDEKVSPDAIAEKRKEYSERMETYIRAWADIQTESCGQVVIVIIDVLKLASEFAIKTTRSETIHVRHLLVAMLLYSYPEYVPGYRKTINDLGLTVEWILEGFPEHLKRFKSDDQEAWRRILAEVIEKQGDIDTEKMASMGMSVAEHGWGDRVADKDKLGFRLYVEVVARFLTHEETELPLTLSVEGEWGSGKSSFLRQLKNEIGRIYKDKGPEKALIVEFDPWRHDKDEALWAAFALKFIGDASKCLTKGKRWKANCELWKQRLSWKQAWPDVLRIVLVGLAWVLATIGICIGLWNGIELGATGTVVLPKWIGSIVALVVSLWAVFGKVKDFLGSPLAVDLKKYMRRPDYVSKVSFIEKFHDDFKRIVSAYAGEERVYVFVDDLDRCEVPKAAELMESINLMISENPNLVFVMGMDREKVAAGLAVKHEKLLPYLAESTKNKDLDKEELKRLRGVRYGYSFIEKFVQVPFSLPRPDEKCINKMLMGLSGQIKGEKKTTGQKQEGEPITKDVPSREDPAKSKSAMSETGNADVSQTQIDAGRKLEAQEHAMRQEQIEEELLKFNGDDPNFRAIVLTVSKAFDFNPRRAKQFVNIFRLRAATAKVTGLYEPKDGKRLWFEQLGKFVGIELGWPLFIRDLEKNPRLLDKLVDVAEGEEKPGNPDSRIKEWAENERLIGLIKSGCYDENETKKTGDEYERFCMRGLPVERLMKVAPRAKQMEMFQ